MFTIDCVHRPWTTYESEAREAYTKYLSNPEVCMCLSLIPGRLLYNYFVNLAAGVCVYGCVY